ncbi:MAG: hypothetical protein ACP5E3_04200 [Bacteroidales bacterium]
MSSIKKIFSLLVIFSIALTSYSLKAQDNIAWLNDYAADMQIGNDTYRYKFTNVEGNNCKIKIEELVTDKKGSTESRHWIFYLSDIDPAAVRFKAGGKSISINMETRQSQKFISYYEEGEFDEYTEEIEMTMNEVDLTRSFIEALKENISTCKETQTAWDDREAAFVWLTENIGEAQDDDIMWEQELSAGDRNYLVKMSSKSTDEDGEQAVYNYEMDLNDINPLAINLDVSGKSLSIEVPVREGKRFIEVSGPDGREYIDEMLIYADDIEVARQIVNALSYVVTNTMPARPQWESYPEALNFISDNVGEVKIDDETFLNSFEFSDSPSGIVEFTTKITDDDGETEEYSYSFYLTDLIDKAILDVSKNSITVKLNTKNDRDYIRETENQEPSGYVSDMEFHVDNIDMARDIMNAFEYATRNSEEKIREFGDVSDISSWLNENIANLKIDNDQYEQKISILPENENQLIFETLLTEDDGETTTTRFMVYPEDLSLEEMEIKVSGNKLMVPLETEKGNFIKNFQNEELQNFTDEMEVLFFDPLVAKNFMAAIRSLKEQSIVEDRTGMSKDEALEFLGANIQNIQLAEDTYEQKLEIDDTGNCKLIFTRVETDDKGESDEYIYEFIASDIHPGNSELAVKGELIEIDLVTRGNEKLIKPYENGEVEDFEDEFAIYVDDVLLAKKTLAAFEALSRECK